uniref:Uncharacterized protein n=2 Tax=Clastoptera arizonana TaxID=38151 RepID=A0A1B6D5U9_9HEMI
MITATLLNTSIKSMSSTKILRDNNLSEEEEVKIFVSQMLINRVFLGDFQERRYVDLLNNYRDVMVIDEQHGDLKRDLDIVKKRLDDYYKGRVWIGMTGPNMVGAPSGHCLWVNLQNQPLGQYWFVIKKVKFLHNEVIVTVKQVRLSSESKTTACTNEEENNEFIEFINSITLKSLSKCFTNTVFPTMKTYFTFYNIKQIFIFLTVLALTIFTGLLHILQYFADFTIRLLKELNVFFHTATPFLLGVLDLIAKIVGGFYILIAMMWRENSGPRMNMQHLKAIEQPIRHSPQQKNKTFADFRRRYQNHDRNSSSPQNHFYENN